MKLKELEKIFESLSNKRRLKITKIFLKSDKLTVSDISYKIKLLVKTTLKHVLHLKNVNILERGQCSKGVYCRIVRLNNPLIKNVTNYISHSSE